MQTSLLIEQSRHLSRLNAGCAVVTCQSAQVASPDQAWVRRWAGRRRRGGGNAGSGTCGEGHELYSVVQSRPRARLTSHAVASSSKESFAHILKIPKIEILFFPFFPPNFGGQKKMI
jgi:hypothetical protein